jgi:type II secretory pathway pseudopilin PulG
MNHKNESQSLKSQVSSLKSESGIWSLESGVKREKIGDKRQEKEEENRIFFNPQWSAGNPQSKDLGLETWDLRLNRNPQSGYALIALLALMAILMLTIVAVAPSIRQQQQREREIEAIIRGEEVAEALRQYARTHNGALPNSLDDLLKGVPSQTKLGKNVQIIRPEALRDPLSSTGEWRVVRVGDPSFKAFQQGLYKYFGTLPPTTDQRLAAKAPQMPPLGLDNLNKATEDKDKAPGGEDDSPNNSFGEIFGVVSRSRRASVVTYYGIERHDHWVFTPFYR